MKKNIILIIVTLISLVACKSKFEDLSFEGGSADFTTFVSVGNSLTAGYADGALYTSGQEYSYPAQLAKQFRLAGANTVFNQPMMNDDNGGVTFLNSVKIEEPKMILGTSTDCKGVSGLGPIRIDMAPTTRAEDNIYASKGPFHNIGVPGSKVIHVDAPGYGDITNLLARKSNPYYVRMASASDATMIEDAVNLNATFFSLWIGNNDVLGYATTGGVGVDPLTSQADFTAAYTNAITKLTANGAKGVVANIPNVTSIPYFTTVPTDPIALDLASSLSLTSFFNKIGNYVDTAFGAGKGAQYRITYVQGDNPFLIKVPATSDNPLGWRQIKSDELVLLTIPQDSIKCAGYGVFDSRQPFDPFTITIEELVKRVNPLQTQHVLTLEEIEKIRVATDGFNATISSLAASKGLALADMHTNMANIKNNGLVFNEVEYKTDFISGGTFSFDGVHPTKRGYALITNYFIDAINAKYGSTVPKVNANTLPGTVLP